MYTNAHMYVCVCVCVLTDHISCYWHTTLLSIDLQYTLLLIGYITYNWLTMQLMRCQHTQVGICSTLNPTIVHFLYDFLLTFYWLPINFAIHLLYNYDFLYWLPKQLTTDLQYAWFLACHTSPTLDLPCNTYPWLAIHHLLLTCHATMTLYWLKIQLTIDLLHPLPLTLYNRKS